MTLFRLTGHILRICISTVYFDRKGFKESAIRRCRYGDNCARVAFATLVCKINVNAV